MVQFGEKVGEVVRQLGPSLSPYVESTTRMLIAFVVIEATRRLGKAARKRHASWTALRAEISEQEVWTKADEWPVRLAHLCVGIGAATPLFALAPLTASGALGAAVLIAT